MLSLTWTMIVIATMLALAYRRSTLTVWTISIAAILAITQASTTWSIGPWIAFAIVAVPLNVKPLRRALLSRHLMRWFRSVLPPISDTESAAIDAGTVWWDRELFTGKPAWEEFLLSPAAELTTEDREFLDGPVEALCEMLDNWKIEHELGDLPPEVWRFMKENRFFGMLIPKSHGGLGLSPRAQSEVVMKISTRSITAGITVMVPNSLGPGELLLHYGTEAQKESLSPASGRWRRKSLLSHLPARGRARTQPQ